MNSYTVLHSVTQLKKWMRRKFKKKPARYLAFT